MKKTIIAILIAYTCGHVVMAAEPNWTINPATFSNSMSMVGIIKIDGQEADDENDMIAAFVNGEIRGVAHLQFEPAVNAYLAYLIIYGSESGANISFKLYDADQDLETEAYNAEKFVINDLTGNVASPFIWSNVVLNTGTEFMAFNFPQGDGDELIEGNEIKVAVKYGTNITALAAEFNTSTNATVWVGGIQQVSGETLNDFSKPVVFKVISESGQELRTVTVFVRTSRDVPSDILISSAEISEKIAVGSFVGELTAVDEDEEDSFTYSLVLGEGDTDNGDFSIVGNKLLSNSVFDTKTKTSYSVRINVEDSDGNTFSRSYVITILPVNESPEIEAQEFSIPERSSTGFSVGTVTSFDVDGDVLVFSIKENNVPFDINSATGEISVSVDALDYEEVSTYILEVQVVDPGGLLAYADITIHIEDIIESELPLPANDFISANDDGFNDLFLVQNVGLYKSYMLTIFNNSGTEVYSRAGYDNSWSGTDNAGHELAPGIYYYSFISSSNPISFKGSLTLVR